MREGELSGASSLDLRVHPFINGEIVSAPDRISVQDLEGVVSGWPSLVSHRSE